MATVALGDYQTPTTATTLCVIAGFILESQRRRDVNDSDGRIYYRLPHQRAHVLVCVCVRMGDFFFFNPQWDSVSVKNDSSPDNLTLLFFFFFKQIQAKVNPRESDWLGCPGSVIHLVGPD